MPLSKTEALKVFTSVFPTRDDILGPIEYNGLYIVQAIDTSDVEEGDSDPFFSINPETSEVRDFSIFTDGNIGEVLKLFRGLKGKEQ